MDRISGSQFKEWEAYARLEPFPEDRVVHAIAIAATRFANGYLRAKNTDRVWTVDDFLPKYHEPEKKKLQSPDEMKSFFSGFLSRHGDEDAKQWAEDHRKERDLPGQEEAARLMEIRKLFPKRTTPPKRLMKR